VWVILIQNMTQAHNFMASSEWLNTTAFLSVLVFASELLIDWAKHGFISKFNEFHPEIYDQFRVILCHDFTASHCDAVIRQDGTQHCHTTVILLSHHWNTTVTPL
jgi:hypothetical protein